MAVLAPRAEGALPWPASIQMIEFWTPDIQHTNNLALFGDRSANLKAPGSKG